MVEKIGPYRVYERLGVGGMGEVFKAFDDRLDRWVAIKRIRPDREDAEDNRERFKREARATARLNHPSIVHLYGIFQDGDSDCIVMEYVDGRGLDTVLADGPLDPLRVATLGHEIASGLAEAHSNGILHRDLKAENIIITPKGRAKILDFGLAKPILRSELDPVLTGKGQLVGTSRAMSPEYVSGDEVDHRSDLFALGVLLYECLTGQSPFKAHNTLATLKQVMLHRQLPAKQLNARVPPELSDLIDRLLEKDPADRPQSAQEVATAFGRLTGQFSSGPVEPPGSGTQPIFQPTTTQISSFSASDTVLDLRPRNRWMTVIAVLIVLLVGAFFLGRYLQKLKPLALPPGEQIRLVLGEFTNHTGQEKFDASVAQAFRASLEQSEALSVLSQPQIREALERMRRPVDARIDQSLGAELAQREGAARLITGSISSIGSNYTVVAQVIEPETSDVVFTSKEVANDEDAIVGAIDKVAAAVRSQLGESLDDIRKTARPLEKVATPNFDALKAYTVAIELIGQFKYDEAVAYLENALALDSGFAMAHAKLAVIFSNKGLREEALRHIQGAMANEDRLSAVERFYVRGWALRWQGTPKQVVENWVQMSNIHPREHPAHWNLAMALLTYKIDYSAAAVAFEKARLTARTEAETKETSSFKGLCLLATGKVTEAMAFFDQAGSYGTENRIDALIAQNNHSAAQAAIASLESPVKARAKKAALLADQGDLAGATLLLEENLDALLPETQLPETQAKPGTNHSVLEAFADLGALYYFRGQHEKLAQLVDSAMAYSATRLEIRGLLTDQSPVATLALLAKYCIRTGDQQRANALLATITSQTKTLEVPVWQALLRMVEAERAFAQGDASAALQRLENPEVDLLWLTESRAYFAEKSGRGQLAVEQLRLIQASRARALTDCSHSGIANLDQIITWSVSKMALARVLRASGDLAGEKTELDGLRSHWGLPPGSDPKSHLSS